MKLIAFAITVWCLGDIALGLENSWILFLYRALAPINLVIAAIIFGLIPLALRFIFRHEVRLLKLAARLSIALLVTGAPILYQLILTNEVKVILPPEAPQTTLLNFNALGYRDLSSELIRAINSNDPDIVTIQELNPAVSAKIEGELKSRYPCRILKPADGSWGMGTLAKWRCRDTTANLAEATTGLWIGPPIVVETESLDGVPLTVANFHAIHPHAGIIDPYLELDRGQERLGGVVLDYITGRVSKPIKDRERAFRELLGEIIGDSSGRRVVLAGDLNATMRNTVYRDILRSGYYDSWLDKHSVATGGSWPAPEFLGSFLGRALGLGWFLRIDFIFRSAGLVTKEIRMLSTSAGDNNALGMGSDHRGMFVSFGFLGEKL
jgi:endonuclease/exonuclease/phosphatase (EEP) superfamily protein YafD